VFPCSRSITRFPDSCDPCSGPQVLFGRVTALRVDDDSWAIGTEAAREDDVLDEDGSPRVDVVRDDLAFVTLPSHSPELNPVEEYWRQLQNALSNRLFDSLDDLTTANDTALDQLSLRKMSNYF
jgi:hypothetical protein